MNVERRVVDGRGLQCPRPVIQTKRVLRELPHGVVEVTVDNEIAVQNLAKMASQMGLPWSSQTISEQEYVVEIRVGSAAAGGESSGTAGSVETAHAETAADAAGPAASDSSPQASQHSQGTLLSSGAADGGPTVVVLAADRMGEGDEQLGRTLMKAFVYALTEADTVPDHILLYNGGVRLAVEGSDCVQDLSVLADRGVEIMSCGACLSFYGLTEQLAVGAVTNMYAIVETLLGAGKIIRP